MNMLIMYVLMLMIGLVGTTYEVYQYAYKQYPVKNKILVSVPKSNDMIEGDNFIVMYNTNFEGYFENVCVYNNDEKKETLEFFEEIFKPETSPQKKREHNE